MTRRSLTCVIGLLSLFHVAAAAEEPLVRVVRVPNGGIQPQVAKDDAGIVHLIYFKGNARAGDLFYVTSGDGGRTFSKPMRVNSQEGSVLAIGTMRGAQLAVGKAGRAHVSWMGSDKAQPRGPGGEGVTPMLYARLNDAKTTFEEQRNVIQEKAGLDGGGSVAADSQGRVYVAWHAPSKRQGDEADRRVWLAVSSDEGKTFAKEQPISPSGLGSCGCCGMRLLADGDAVYALFRSAREMVHRDMYLIKMKDEAGRAVGSQNQDLKSQISDHSAHKLDEWQTGTCPASTAAFTHAKGDVLAAWESKGQVWFSHINGGSERAVVQPASPPGKAGNRKHPALARDDLGRVLLAWAAGAGWEKGGDVGWQVFDSAGQVVPGEGAAGLKPGLPVWGLPAAFFDGKQFVVMF